jgi:hypothetical protein
MADGGRADFRGEHNKIFNFLSSPNISLNVKTTESDFQLKDSFVHGTFMTEAFITILTCKYTTLKIFMKTLPAGAAYVDILKKSKLQKQIFIPHWKEEIFDNEIVIITKEQTCIVKTQYWEITISVRPIFGAVKAFSKRLDISLKQLQKHTVYPHGILGQSYDDDGIGIDGKIDEYKPGDFTTKAQAEGAIEGTYKDYIMKEPFSSEFKFSRFNETINKPRNINNLNGRRIYKSQFIQASAS